MPPCRWTSYTPTIIPVPAGRATTKPARAFLSRANSNFSNWLGVGIALFLCHYPNADPGIIRRTLHKLFASGQALCRQIIARLELQRIDKKVLRLGKITTAQNPHPLFIGGKEFFARRPQGIRFFTQDGESIDRLG